MMKRILAVAVTTLIVTNSAEVVSPDSTAMQEIYSGDFKLGAMIESDYGIGVSMLFGHLLDVKAGHEGAGIRYNF